MSTNKNNKNRNKKPSSPKKQQTNDENIIVLQADDGENVRFEFLDLVEYEGNNYVVLLPVDEGDGSEVTILQIEEIDEETDSYFGVDDDEILQAVFKEFKKNCN